MGKAKAGDEVAPTADSPAEFVQRIELAAEVAQAAADAAEAHANRAEAAEKAAAAAATRAASKQHASTLVEHDLPAPTNKVDLMTEDERTGRRARMAGTYPRLRVAVENVEAD